MKEYKETQLFTTPEATATIGEFVIDETSTEMCPLYICDIFVGNYSWGLFSKFCNISWKNGTPIGDLKMEARNILYNQSGIKLRDAAAVLEYEKNLKIKGTSIMEQLTAYMCNVVNAAN